MQKLHKVLLIVCLALAASCSWHYGNLKERYTTDKEVCVADDAQILHCNNKSLPDNKRTYTRHLNAGDVVTNGDDAVTAVQETVDMIIELKKCHEGKI